MKHKLVEAFKQFAYEERQKEFNLEHVSFKKYFEFFKTLFLNNNRKILGRRRLATNLIKALIHPVLFNESS